MSEEYFGLDKLAIIKIDLFLGCGVRSSANEFERVMKATSPNKQGICGTNKNDFSTHIAGGRNGENAKQNQ